MKSTHSKTKKAARKSPASAAPSREKISQTLGLVERKTTPRSNLASFDAKARHQDPLALLEASNHDRVASLVKLKHQRMACSPFAYFRGAAPVMAYDLSLGARTGIVTQLCGDAHVQNLGAYEGMDGRLIFDINDFDETIRGPFEWDIKRMAVSILLAAGTAKIKHAAAAEAVRDFVAGYARLMETFARMPILAVARYQVHRLGNIEPVSKILRQAERQTPQLSLKRLTEMAKGGRRFRSNPPTLRPVSGDEARSVLASLPAYRDSLLPERRHFLDQFKPIAVAFKVVGTGSVGLRDYCVLLEGNGAKDPLFLQIKQEARSVYAPYLHEPEHQHDGRRTAEGQRAMQLQSDPLLGWTSLDGRPYLVRQLNDHKAAVDIASLKSGGLCAYVSVCAEMLARGHARSGDARIIASYIGGGSRFQSAIARFAESYAAQSVQDWKALVAAHPKAK